MMLGSVLMASTTFALELAAPRPHYSVVVQASSLPSCLAQDGVRWEPDSSEDAFVCPRQGTFDCFPWEHLVMPELSFFLLVAPTDELVLAAPCLSAV